MKVDKWFHLYSRKFDIVFEEVSCPAPIEWIPVTEGLPRDGEIKLVTCKTKKGILNVNRAYYMDGHWHGSGSMSNVIAWMDLPEPYEEEREDDDNS